MNLFRKKLSPQEYENLMRIIDKADQEAESFDRESCVRIQKRIEVMRQRIQNEYEIQGEI